MECELPRTVDFPNHEILIKKIIKTYCDDKIFDEGEVNIEKVDPIMFVMNDRSYRNLGKRVEKA